MIIAYSEKLNLAYGPFESYDQLQETARHYAAIGHSPYFLQETALAVLVEVPTDPEEMPDEAEQIRKHIDTLQARLDYLDSGEVNPELRLSE